MKVTTKFTFIFVLCQLLIDLNHRYLIRAARSSESSDSPDNLNEVLSRSYDHSRSEDLVFKIVGTEIVDWCPEFDHALKLSFEFTPENVMHPAISCANAYSRLLKMAMCLNPRTTLDLFKPSSGAAIEKRRNFEMNLKKMDEILQIAINQQFRPTAMTPAHHKPHYHRWHNLVRKVSLNLLLLGKVKAALFWWVLQENRTTKNNYAILPKSCSQAFQAAVPSLLQQGEYDAAAAVLELLSEITHLRSSFSSEKAIRECMLTEARVHLLRKGFRYAMITLQSLLIRHKGPDDALAMEGVCLLNHAREALLVWDGYEQHYAHLSSVLSSLFRSDAPYACQCIAPFSALSSPLSPADMLNVAASAARRELARLPDARSVAGPWYLASAGLLATSQGAQGAGGRRLRVGYVTSEFGDNSVGREMAAVAGAHAHTRVVVACFFLSPPNGSGPPSAGKHDSAEEWRRRMARCVDESRVS
jgi:hypothetical protein